MCLFSKDWAEEYVNMPPIDRVIKIITILTNKYYDYIEKIPENRKNQYMYYRSKNLLLIRIQF